MPHTLWKALITILLCMSVLAGGIAPAQSPSGQLAMRVTDAKGEAIADATVTLKGVTAPIVQMTDDKGRALFRGLPTGNYQVTVAKAGYAPVQIPDAEVGAAASTLLFATLKPSSAEAPRHHSNRPGA